MRDPLAPRMRWWGWGEDARAAGLPPQGEALLRDELGADAGEQPRAALEDVRLSVSSYPDGLRARLEAIVGEGHLRDDRLSRVSHALGKSYIDLLRIRSGDGSSAPDAVVYPGSHDEVAAVLAACADAGVAVVPFGGGTSVVGGVEPLREGFSAAISLDLARMDRLTTVDLRSLSATFAPGITGPRAEAALSARGLTLGHYPQSFEYATVGGFVATRSAGQASTGYGRIDELVLGLRCAAPAGEIGSRTLPATAAGPSLRELLVGSEGVLGVVTEVTLAVRPAPEVRRFEGWSVRSFEEGAEAFRLMEQAEASPDVARLSDEEETRISMTLASSGSVVEKAGKAYLRARGQEGGCIVIVGFEGEAREVERRRARTAAALRSAGAVALGERPGRSWEHNRYGGPYLRDALLDRGLLVETLETAATWGNLGELYRRVGGALRETLAGLGTPPVVMCHISHLYPSGASLYFTVLARRTAGEEIAQWRAAKAAAGDAIIAAGGTITHHHAVGADHTPWMAREVGELGLDVLRAAKARLDPAGIMNPGKLLPA